MNTKIVSFGGYVPQRVVTNKDLEKMLNTTDEWIQQRSGIQERRWVEASDTTLSMGTAAAKEALKNANLEIDDIDAIIFGCLVSDHVFPGTGCLLQHSLGCKKPIPALDIRNQCSGFLYALSVAQGWIALRRYRRILIIASEIHSKRLDRTERGRDVAVLFGDGAGACVVEATDGPGIIDIQLASEGENAHVLVLKEPGGNFDFSTDLKPGFMPDFFPKMEGRLVFKHAVTRMTESMNEILLKNKFSATDVDFVVAHQANMRINSMVLENLKIPWEKTHHTLQKYGNTTMATIPLTMGEAVAEGKIKRGDLVALTAFGAGFTWGSALLRF